MEHIHGSERIALLALLMSAACGDGDMATGPTEAESPNQAPRAVDDIADLDLIRGERDAVLDVSGYFRDGDGDALSFSAVSGDETVAAVRMSGSTLTVKSVSPGDATISRRHTEVGTASLRALAAFGCVDESIGLTAPSSAGVFCYAACVDAVTGESDTGNNCSRGMSVTVAPSPFRIEIVFLEGFSDADTIQLPGRGRVGKTRRE